MWDNIFCFSAWRVASGELLKVNLTFFLDTKEELQTRESHLLALIYYMKKLYSEHTRIHPNLGVSFGLPDLSLGLKRLKSI